MKRSHFLLLLGAAPLASNTGCSRQAEPLPDLGPIPDVELIAQDGRPTKLTALHGAPLFVAFFFTRCPSVCPRLAARMKEIAESLGPSSSTRFVLISVDPEHDTPGELTKFARRHGLSAARFTLLTGDHTLIAAAAESGFKIGVSGSYAADQADGGITHGSHLVLVDQAGRIRKYLRSFEDDTVDQAKRALDSLGTLPKG